MFLRNLILSALLVLNIIIISNSSIAAIPEITSSLNKTTVSTGEFFIYEVKIKHPADLKWQTIHPEEKLKENFDVDVMKSSIVKAEKDENEISTFKWRIWPRTPGKYEIPAFLVLSRSINNETKEPDYVGKTNSIPFEVIDPLSKIPEEQAVLKDIKPPIPLPPEWKKWLLYIFSISMIFVLAGGIYWFIKVKKSKPVIIPPEPPHQKALRRLRELKNFIGANPRELQEYFYLLSEIFREYLEGVFDFPAISMTTEELIPALECDQFYKSEEKQAMILFFQQADLIKYADVSPLKNEMESAYSNVFSWIEKHAYFADEDDENSSASENTQ